jgi:predicted GIY-YIG superfamily endonuclease
LRSLTDDAIVVGVSWVVYILRCADGSLYIGHTGDITNRISQHNEGRASAFTGRRRPVTIVYSETHATRRRACQRERQLKRWRQLRSSGLSQSRAAAPTR